MVKQNAVVSVSDSNVPQEARKDNTIDFVKVLSQFPTYIYKGNNGWMVVKDICEKSGYSRTTSLTELVVDNKNEVITLKGADLEEFKAMNITFIASKFTNNLIIIGPNAFIEAVNRSTIPFFKSVREQSKDVLLRYIKGEQISIQNDLENAYVEFSNDPSVALARTVYENALKMATLKKEQQKHAQELVEHTMRLDVIEKKMSELDRITEQYENGQITEFEYYCSMAKQTIKDIVSSTKMQYSDVYHGVVEIYTTMPHYCKKTDKKSIFKVMAERKDSVELALNFYKSARMFKEKVS